jgi:hypothetical protein
MAQPGKQVVDGLGDNPGPIAILDVGRMDHHTHTQARRVGHNMALATFDFFGRIVEALQPHVIPGEIGLALRFPPIAG